MRSEIQKFITAIRWRLKMYRTLTEFYTSKEWRAFRQQLIHDRTSKADGILYDEYSGKPLLKSYDIIAHHKQQLTLQNVNDYAISLNPENIMLVSMRSHNEIHSRFGYTQGRKVYYIYGAPCSGKSTWVESVKGNSDLVADIDLVWQAITGGRKYFKPDALKACAFQIYNDLLDMVKTRQGKWERAYIITGGAHKGQRERQIAELGAEPIYINTDQKTCLQRLHNDTERAEIKDRWAGYIADWFKAYQR